MVLLGIEGIKSKNLAEMEMKMENDNFGVRKLYREMEMDKGNHEINNQEMDMKEEVGEFDDDEEEIGGDDENGVGFGGVNGINDSVGGYNKDLPPVDDVCPICFDGFTVPCRSNCGHWFCASCILQFWMFKSSIQPCKCPLCCCRIVNLKPETSPLIQPVDHETVEVLKRVHQYNGLYISGLLGIFHRLLALPLFMRRIFRVLIDPDGLRCIYYGMRIIGLFLALLYEKWEFEFVPTGGLGIQRTFDVGASVLIVTLFFIGLGYRFVLRGRVRRLAAMQAWDS